MYRVKFAANQQVESIRGALTKRVLDMLSKMASKQPEDYDQFWDTFGAVIKEGPPRILPIAKDCFAAVCDDA